MAPGYSDGLVYVSTVPTDARPNLPGRRGRHAVGARRQNRARKYGTSTPCRKTSGGTRKSTPAAASGTRPRSTAKARSSSAPATRRRSRATPQEPWGSSRPGPEPLHQLDGQARRQDRQDGLVLPADAARHLRLGLPEPADPDRAPAARNWRSAPASRASSSRVDAKTGKPVWKRPVGTHNGHDEDGLYAMRGEYSKIKTGRNLPRARSAA